MIREIAGNVAGKSKSSKPFRTLRRLFGSAIQDDSLASVESGMSFVGSRRARASQASPTGSVVMIRKEILSLGSSAPAPNEQGCRKPQGPVPLVEARHDPPVASTIRLKIDLHDLEGLIGMIRHVATSLGQLQDLPIEHRRKDTEAITVEASFHWEHIEGQDVISRSNTFRLGTWAAMLSQ